MGVQTYSNSIVYGNKREHDLFNPKRNVLELKKVLESSGVSASAVTGRNVNAQNIEAKINRLVEISNVKPYQYDFIIYYSGHGAVNNMCFWDGFYEYRKFLPLLAKIKAKHIFMFVDDCHGGSAGQFIMNGSSDEVNQKLIFFSASRGNETSLDSGLLAHAFFTNSLIEGLRGFCDSNEDKIIDVMELYKFICIEVMDRSRNFNALPPSERTDRGGNVLTVNMHPQLYAPGFTQEELKNTAIIRWE
jgi:uncharacterized caspase-like protein